MLLFAVVALHLLLLRRCALADPAPYYNSTDYEYGKLGIYPEVFYQSSPLAGLSPNIRTWKPQCDSGQYYFIAPRGLLMAHVGPMILDQQGYMVWRSESYGMTYGFMVQKYRGDNYLTFWAGDDNVIGHGSGYYYMLDSSYTEYKKIGALNGLMGDLHEFKITADNTALLTAYLKVPADLSLYDKPVDSYIYDCYFQEISIDTNELLFEWRATDHFSLEDCYNQPLYHGTDEDPFDYYHINSVDKDPAGNYIVSARYSHAITYIDGRDGHIIWHLGGKNNSFVDLSDGRATHFAWQHEARWHNDYTSISIFDNNAYFGDNDNTPRGIHVAIDTQAMTAKLIGEYIHTDYIVSESQGSMQVLDNGNVFLGYGSAAAFTEFSPSGEVLCDVQFGSLHYTGTEEFTPMAVMSYRAYKQDWVGHPAENPRVKFIWDYMFVSWNGATEVKWWILEGSTSFDLNPDKYQMIERIEKIGFESNMTVGGTGWVMYRLTALTKDSAIAGQWVLNGQGDVLKIPPSSVSTSHSRSSLSTGQWSLAYGALITFGGIFLALLIGRAAYRKIHRRWGFPLWRTHDHDMEKVSLMGDQSPIHSVDESFSRLD